MHVQHKVYSVPLIGKDRGFDIIFGMDILLFKQEKLKTNYKLRE